eukprot:Lankesteria_metandrocarpae@DN5363_c0_g1_i3.p3
MTDLPEGSFDNLFANVASSAQGIENLLDVFFGFLQRKTDFFVSNEHSSPEIESIVLKVCRKHQAVADKRRATIAAENKRKDEERGRRAAVAAAQNSNKPTTIEKRIATSNPKIEEIIEEVEVPTQNSAKDDDDDDDDGFNPAKHGNGGITEKYVWTQTLSTVEVFVEVPPGTKANQCRVELTPTVVKIGLKGKELLVDGKWHLRVKVDDSCWTLVENKSIHLTIEKSDGMRWWNCVVEGDPTIDTKKIVPDNSKLSDLDGETRATVEKMLHDQRQKEMGLPTSDQKAQADLFERFKSQHPEMDFSGAKINYGGGGGMFPAGFNLPE